MKYTFPASVENSAEKQLLFKSVMIQYFGHDEAVLENYCAVTQRVANALEIENSGV